MNDPKNAPKNSKQNPQLGRQPDKADFRDDEFEIPTYDGSKALKSTEQKTDPVKTSAKESKSAQVAGQANAQADAQAARTEQKDKDTKAKETKAKETKTQESKVKESKPAHSEVRTSIFERAGRAAPQRIEPNSGVNRAEHKQNSQTVDPAHNATASEEAAETTQFQQQSAQQQNQQQQAQRQQQQAQGQQQQPAAHDENRPEYRDEDFAATEVIDPAGKQTTVPVEQSASPVQQTPAGAVNGQQYPDEQPYAQGSQELLTGEQQPKEDPGSTDDIRRGTIDLGLFLLRIVFSAWLIIQGVGTFFTLGDYDGIAGLESEFSAYNQAHLLAVAVPAAQLAAGIFLLLGLLAPLAAMVALAVTGFMAVHQVAVDQAGLNIFNWAPTLWLPVIAAAIAVIVQFTGPGLYSLDGARAWARRPLASSWIFVIIGIAAVVAAWWLLAGTNPLAS